MSDRGVHSTEAWEASLRQENANLRQALLDAHHTVSALVAAAGGSITVPWNLLHDNYVLQRESTIDNGWIFRVRRANMAEEMESARSWRAGP